MAVSSPGGKGIEVACLDPGSLGLTSAGGLPVPLRRLCARASKVGRVVIANDLAKGAPQASPADDHAALESVLVAPVIIAGDVAGLVGLINKPGGFSAADSRLVEVFAEMAAVAMLNSSTVNGLEKNQSALETEVREGATQLRQAEEKFKTLVENLPDVIARFDPDLRHLYVSPAVQRVTGRPPQDFVGKTNRELGMPSELVEAWDAALRRVFATGRPERFEFAFPAPDGTRHFDCRLVPEPGPGGAIPSVLSVARDVTDRWLAYEAERRARAIADALREATVRAHPQPRPRNRAGDPPRPPAPDGPLRPRQRHAARGGVAGLRPGRLRRRPRGSPAGRGAAGVRGDRPPDRPAAS